MPHYFDFPITEYLLTIICFYIVNHPLPCKKYFGAKDWAKKWKRGGAVLRGLKTRQRKATKEQPWLGLQNYYREAIKGKNSRRLTSLNLYEAQAQPSMLSLWPRLRLVIWCAAVSSSSNLLCTTTFHYVLEKHHITARPLRVPLCTTI